MTNRGNGNPNIVDNHIKYLVGEVNKEFDIDINIEIEIAYQKAIARGEKPSTRLAIKEFQKRIAKEDRQKAWQKNITKRTLPKERP